MRFKEKDWEERWVNASICSDLLHKYDGSPQGKRTTAFLYPLHSKSCKEWIEIKVPGGLQDLLTSKATSVFVAIRR